MVSEFPNVKHILVINLDAYQVKIDLLYLAKAYTVFIYTVSMLQICECRFV